MLGFAVKGLFGLALLASGWFAGSIYPAPEQWTVFVKGRASPILAHLDLNPAALAQLRSSLSPVEFTRLAQNAAVLAASTGDVIRIEHTTAEMMEEHADAPLAQTPVATSSAPGSVFEPKLYLCPGMTVTNAPPADEHNLVQDYASVINVNGVALAVNPTRGACLSSGVGSRSGRRHKGLDLYSRNGGPIFAAGSGTVIEKLYRDDYGNMLLIDHGQGVYTRYAHLSSFASDIDVGAAVTAGQQIGLMGNTASYPIPVHLHYELLVGDYANGRQSFGLDPRSPFEFAPATLMAEAQARPDRVASDLDPRRSRTQISSLVPMQLTRAEVGRELCPGGPLNGAALITIRHGDTLSAIARACYGDEEAWRLIASCNHFLEERNLGGVSPLNGGHLLYVGDRLALPAPGASCAT